MSDLSQRFNDEELELSQDDLVELLRPLNPEAAKDGMYDEAISRLRDLLGRGLLLYEGQMRELRHSLVFTHHPALRSALEVGEQTVRHVVQELQLEHWIVADRLGSTGALRLLGPPRFKIRLRKENIWGAVHEAVGVHLPSWTSALESIDHTALETPKVEIRKDTRLLGKGKICSISLPPHEIRNFRSPGKKLKLGAESRVQLKSREYQTLGVDVEVELARGAWAVLPRDLPAMGLRRGDAIKLQTGNPTTEGELEVRPRLLLDNGRIVDWGPAYGPWLERWEENGVTPLLMQRVIYVVLRDVFREPREWRVLVGIHDAMINGAIARRLDSVPEWLSDPLATGLRELGPSGSIRDYVQRHCGLKVDQAHVVTSEPRRASISDMALLREITGDFDANRDDFGYEIIFTGEDEGKRKTTKERQRIPMWFQVGEYGDDEFGVWEITLERYLTDYVSMEFGGRFSASRSAPARSASGEHPPK